MEELEKSSSSDTDGRLMGLPETESELDNLTEFNTAHNRRITMIGIFKILVWFMPQFYIKLVFKAPLCITLTISDQKIVSGSLFFQLFQKKKKKKKL